MQSLSKLNEISNMYRMYMCLVASPEGLYPRLILCLMTAVHQYYYARGAYFLHSASNHSNSYGLKSEANGTHACTPTCDVRWHASLQRQQAAKKIHTAFSRMVLKATCVMLCVLSWQLAASAGWYAI